MKNFLIQKATKRKIQPNELMKNLLIQSKAEIENQAIVNISKKC